MQSKNCSSTINDGSRRAAEAHTKNTRETNGGSFLFNKIKKPSGLHTLMMIISESQPHQQPLKRKAGLRAKQGAGKSVDITNCVTIPDSKAVGTTTVDEYTPVEMALQNDLVLESFPDLPGMRF